MEAAPQASRSGSWTVVDVLAGLAASATMFATAPALAPLLGLGRSLPAEVVLRVLVAVAVLIASIKLSKLMLTGPLSRVITDKEKTSRVAGCLAALFALVILVFWI